MKWKAGGFRADVPNGRYRVTFHHTLYARIGTVFVELKANGKVVFDGEVDYRTDVFDADVTEGHLTIEWRQPTVNVRVPSYAVRGIVIERFS
jgi:hypothetical protein